MGIGYVTFVARESNLHLRQRSSPSVSILKNEKKKKGTENGWLYFLLGVYANEANWSRMSHRTFFHRRRARWRNRNFIRPIEEGGKGKYTIRSLVGPSERPAIPTSTENGASERRRSCATDASQPEKSLGRKRRRKKTKCRI